ncbi:MAG: ATP phosphoribosyltransferase regulatory subunit, partial [Thermoleophilia bacterium]
MIPEGMRDVLPPEAAELRAIEQIVLARFNAYGYGEVRPPALEYPETMERTGVDLLSSGFHLYDERGRALVLRTDLTTAVARLAADRLRERPLPLRLAYEGPVYRTEPSRHRREGEFVQLGAELLGLGSAQADAEVVVLLCDALTATGLQGFRLAIGSVAFHRELVAALGLTPDDS